jgi:ubiquinone biosynthesis protein UbiJ
VSHNPDYGNTVPFFFVGEPSPESQYSRIEPPAWAIDETQRRIVLLLNHVLMQEPQATERWFGKRAG